MIETDGDEQVVPNSPTIPYQEAFRTHLRVCERIEIALTVSGNYFCLPGEGGCNPIPAKIEIRW